MAMHVQQQVDVKAESRESTPIMLSSPLSVPTSQPPTAMKKSCSNGSISESSFSSSSPCETASSPKPKKIKKEHVDAMFIETLKVISDISKSSHAKEGRRDVNDDDYHFAMQVMGTLKRLTNQKKALAKVYILQYLTSMEYDIHLQEPLLEN